MPDALSMTTPLVPPVTEAVAEVGVAAERMLSMSKDMRQPVAAGHRICASPVMALPATLKKIRSLLVPVLLNSVSGEQAALAVVSVGPTVGGDITLFVIEIPHNAVTVPLVLHTYKSPEPVDEVL